MTITFIIALCVLLLLAYVFDLTSARTKLPSVILLLLFGWITRQVADLFEDRLPEMSGLLPVLGTIGLILIVLEGSLELEMNKSKTRMIRTSFLMALFPMVVLAVLIAGAFHIIGGFPFKDSLANVIPLCIISSAVAIPSAKNLVRDKQELVIYESSLSDILGVLFFNFIALNEVITVHSFGHFGLQLIIIAVISFIATAGLSYLLSKIDHHVKFVPIIILVILIYAISKFYHLPALIPILVFGLFLGNFHTIKQLQWIRKFNLGELDTETRKFRDIVMESTFVIRALFFLLFGYLIETHEILNSETILWAIGIVSCIFLIRYLQLKVFRIEIAPLVYLAPRGLITILLFLAIPPQQTIPLMNRALIIQVIILTAVVMMIGLMKEKNPGSVSVLEIPATTAEQEITGTAIIQGTADSAEARPVIQRIRDSQEKSENTGV